MRPGLMLTAGAACALAGTGDLGLLGLLVPRWVAATGPAAAAPEAVRDGAPLRTAAPPAAEAPPAERAGRAEVAPRGELMARTEVTARSEAAPRGEVTVRAEVRAASEVARRVPPPASTELAPRVADPAPALVVHFAAESVDLDDPGARSLSGLVAQLDRGARLRVEGHADASGREEGHQYFSRLRARTVTRRLLQLGVQPTAVSSAAFGASRPLDPAHTLEAMARNRRVEVFIDQGRR